MSYLRLIHSIDARPVSDMGCLEAYEQELDYLFETLRRLGAGTREIEDLAQEVFLVLYRNWSKLDKSRPLRPYLFGIAFRVVSAHRRRHRRELLREVIEIKDTASDPENELQGRQSVDVLMKALERVPLPRRAVLVMHYLDDVPVRDIARRLSLTRFGTYARLRKAQRELAAAVRRSHKEKAPR